MNAIDPCDVIARTDESVNAQSIVELLKELLARNQSANKIYLVCDNARYYKNKAVKEFLEKILS